jgi:hypothetical protein
MVNGISGAIGLSIFKNRGKYYCIFYDDHHNSSYCGGNDSVFIDKFVKVILGEGCSRKAHLFVEELKYPSVKMEYMWKNSKHLGLFNKLLENLDECSVSLTDIRNCFLPFDIDIYDETDRITNGEYFHFLFYFFDLVSNNEILNEKHRWMYEKIELLKKCKDDNSYYNAIKEKVVQLKNELNMNEFLNKKMQTKQSNFYKRFPFIEISRVSECFSVILDGIMEYYTMCCIFNKSKKINIVYYGLAHTTNIAYFMEEKCGFKIIYNSGFTYKNMATISNFSKIPNGLRSCVRLDDLV